MRVLFRVVQVPTSCDSPALNGQWQNLDEAVFALVDAAIASPATLQQWSAAARRHVEERFRIENEAAALNALYRELLAAETSHDAFTNCGPY